MATLCASTWLITCMFFRSSACSESGVAEARLAELGAECLLHFLGMQESFMALHPAVPIPGATACSSWQSAHLQFDVVGGAGAPHRQLRRQREAVLCAPRCGYGWTTGAGSGQGREWGTPLAMCSSIGRGGQHQNGPSSPQLQAAAQHAVVTYVVSYTRTRTPLTFQVWPLAADRVGGHLTCNGQVAVPRLGAGVEEHHLRRAHAGCRGEASAQSDAAARTVYAASSTSRIGGD